MATDAVPLDNCSGMYFLQQQSLVKYDRKAFIKWEDKEVGQEVHKFPFFPVK